MRNPLTDVTGPEFLGLFAILIAVVALFCWRRWRTHDDSSKLPPLTPPDTIDPYEMACFSNDHRPLTTDH
jgi:hypothetical protein